MYGPYYNRIVPNDQNKTSVFAVRERRCPWPAATARTQQIADRGAARRPLRLGRRVRRRATRGFQIRRDLRASSVIDPPVATRCLRDARRYRPTTARSHAGVGRPIALTLGAITVAEIKMVGYAKVMRRRLVLRDEDLLQGAHVFELRRELRHDYEFNDATHTSVGERANAACSPSKYPLGPLAGLPPTFAGLGATRLEYVTLSFGDAPPENKYINMNDRFLPDTPGGRVVHTFGANEDLDVAASSPRTQPCAARAINHANCFMSGQAYVDESFTPTKLEKGGSSSSSSTRTSR